MTARDDDPIISRYSQLARAALGGEAITDGEPDDGCFGAAAYADRSQAPEAAFRASLGCGNPLTVAELRPGETVLDLGSGGGLDVLLSARRVAPDGVAYGLDASTDMLTLARANAGKARITNARFLQGDIENIPLPDDHVDVVISNCVINLSGDKPRVLAEAFRVLRPGGRLGVSDVTADDGIDPAQLARAEQQVGCLAGALTQLEYERLLGAAGFAGITITSTSHAADGLHSAIIQATKPEGQGDLLRAAVAGDARSHREAEVLIADQYDGRPRLRLVLDAVLAALPAVGPVTVQARKTLVSLSTPRRVFAVVQATTNSRVDLGLRLEHERPGGRLLAARDIGAATVRIPLTRPEDVDAEVLGWLRRAYEENAAPPPARRPARRPAPTLGTITVVIEGSSLPGRTWPPGNSECHNLHVALCTKTAGRPALVVPGKPWLATEPVPGDAPSARWEVPVTVRRDKDGFDFSGPSVRGDRADRHLFLAWGDVHGGTLRLIRGSKLKLADIDPRLVEGAFRPGYRLVARIRLTGARGAPALTWSARPTDGGHDWLGAQQPAAGHRFGLAGK